MLLKNNLDKIKTIVNNKVLTSKEELYCYSQDASNMVNTEAKLPDAVVFAESIEEIQNLVRYANENCIPIISRGAGTNMVGACLCPHGGVVLNFSRMNKILEIDTVNMTARVQAGVTLGELKKEAESKGLFYPPDPSNYKVSTVGGSIAQSSGGAMSFKYGTTKDYVLSLKVVTAEGNLITLGHETPKDSFGYHLNQLMVGSEGTLGIIVEAVLKLIPKPEMKRTISAYFNSIENATDYVNKIILSGISPSAIEFMDKNSVSTVEDYLNCGLSKEYECLILIEIDGFEASVNEQIKKAGELIKNYDDCLYKVYSNETESEEIWNARRSSYAAVTRLAPDVISDDIIVPRTKITEMIYKCKQISDKYKLKMCLVGHLGDGNLHPQIALNQQNEEEFKNLISAKSEIYKEASLLGGSVSAEHGIGLEKILYFENTIDKGAIEYMRSIKKIFDSKNILNPGKIFELR